MARLRLTVRRSLAGLALLAAPSVPAAADEAARALAAEHLAAGTLADGDEALSAILAADATNDDARFGLGVIRFVDAIENLSQGLYRYGLRAPDTMVLPIVRLPVPDNPNPEKVTYAAFRELLVGFVADLGSAEETLAGITSDEARLPLDLLEIRYDVDGDGTVADGERFAEVIAVVTGLDIALLAEGAGAGEIAGDPPVGAPAKGKPTVPAPPAPPGPGVSATTLGFDRADALWLRGYTHVLMAFGEFMLAHDWQLTFDATFHLFFPESSFPFADALDRRRVDPTGFLGDAGPIADMISFVHLFRWEPTEPERMGAALAHLETVIALSRETWEAVGRETDDDREWLPGPEQASPLGGLVDEQTLTGWRMALDEAEAILRGEKLIPHWRFREGVNFRRVFEEPTTFDLVLWITGPAALPYLEPGVETTGEDWERIDEILRGGLAGYALWFN